MKVRLALAQMGISPLDVRTNMKKAEFLIKKASSEGSDIICLPELFLTGLVIENMSKYAQEIPGEYTDIFCKLAEENKIHIVMGSINEKVGDKYYNTSVLINDSGGIVGKYRKIYLWNGEKRNTEAGAEVSLFDTKFGKVGLEICWDLTFSELSKEIALKGAKMIFCSALWTKQDKYDIICDKSAELREALPEIDTETKLVDSCVQARAIENGVVFAFACGCGSYQLMGQSRDLLGHSQIAIPFYGTIAMLEDEEDLLVKEVDLSLVNLAEEVYEIRKDSEERRG